MQAASAVTAALPGPPDALNETVAPTKVAQGGASIKNALPAGDRSLNLGTFAATAEVTVLTGA